jgi:enterobacterial common antigen flippase
MGCGDSMSPYGNSYRQTLRSWSIMGGAAGLNYLLALVRIKIVAILLGPSGVGLIGLYTSAIGLVGTISSFGIGSSAVREVARAFNEEDARAVARTARILQRACWATGIFGWLLAVLLAKPLSIWLFDSTERAIAISILGVTLLFNALAAGRQALLQGLRRIEDVARANILGTVLSTVVAIGLYAWLGKDGILPVLVTTALISLALAYWFSRRVRVIANDVSWEDTIEGTKQLLGLGVAFMLISVTGAAVDTLTRSIVTNEFGVHAAGIYQAAWALSGTFAGIILAAMATDFYPRLSAVIHDEALAMRQVNEQIEIGILMVLPGLVGTLFFAPVIMEVVYTRDFVAGAELLRWMVLGIFSKVLSWPTNFIPIAKGSARLVIAADALYTSIQIVSLFWMEHMNGLVGVAQATAAALALQSLIMLWVGRRLIGFAWSSSVKRLVAISSGYILACFTIPLLMKGSTAALAGGLVTLTGCIVSWRGLTKRLGSGNLLTEWIACAWNGWTSVLQLNVWWRRYSMEVYRKFARDL